MSKSSPSQNKAAPGQQPKDTEATGSDDLQCEETPNSKKHVLSANGTVVTSASKYSRHTPITKFLPTGRKQTDELYGGVYPSHGGMYAQMSGKAGGHTSELFSGEPFKSAGHHSMGLHLPFRPMQELTGQESMGT